MPLEMPRIEPRHPQRHCHSQRHSHRHAQNPRSPYGTNTAAARTDEEEDAADAWDTSTHSDGQQRTAQDACEGCDADCGNDTCGDLCCAPLAGLRKPVVIGELGSHGYAGEAAFWIWPLFGPLLFENSSSDARDGLANERTFLSYLRLAVTMSVVAVAIVLSFHLKNEPSPLELRMAQPLGIIFWLLSLTTLFLGVANYIKTVNKYSRRTAIVQTGWKTQSIMAIIALSILGSCVTLLVVNKITESKDGGIS